MPYLMFARGFVVASLLTLPLLAGCDSAPNDDGGISGRWAASYRGNEIDLDLVRSQGRLAGSGSWLTDGGSFVAVSVDGIYDHPDVAFELESTQAPFVVTGVFEGVVDDDFDTMTGSFGSSQYITFSRR